MGDLLDDRPGVEALADRVFGFEEEVIRQMPTHGLVGVAFYDDWGTQSGMIVSPGLWRELFKERYRRQFDLAHAGRLDVYFHTCGLVEALGRRWGGEVCFVCPVNYQTTSITGTREQIFAAFRDLGGCRPRTAARVAEGKTLTDLVVQGLEARIGSGGREGSLPMSTASGGLQAGVTWERLAESMDTGEAHR